MSRARCCVNCGLPGLRLCPDCLQAAVVSAIISALVSSAVTLAIARFVS